MFERENKALCLKVFNTNSFLANYTQNSKFLLIHVSRGTKIHKKFFELDAEISLVIIEK